MPTPTTQRPAPDEYAPFYAGYVNGVPDGDVAARLITQLGDALASLAPLSDDAALFRYAAGKWSVKDVVGHFTDAERVFSYRLLCIARGEAAPLPGFDENAYVASAGFDRLPLAQLLHAFRIARENTITLVHSLRPADWNQRGTASGKPVTVRALAWIIAGHELHHRNVLKERYGVK